MINLFLQLPENPKGTSQMKGEMVRGGRIHHYTKKNIVTQAAIYENAIREALDGSEPPMYDGPLFLKVIFKYQIKDKKRWGQWKTSKPDLDNAVKLLQDVLCKMGFFEDDSQIAKLRVEKWLSSKPEIEIEIGMLIQP